LTYLKVDPPFVTGALLKQKQKSRRKTAFLLEHLSETSNASQ